MPSGTWTSVANSGAWNTVTNWSGSTVANGSGFTANFTSNITTQTNINTTTGANWSGTIGSITFSDNGTAGFAWVLEAQATITLVGGTPTITTTTDAFILSAISTGAAITKAGSAQLTLTSPSNVFSSGSSLTVSAGTFAVNTGQFNAFGFGGAAVPPPVTLSSGTTLTANNTANNAHNIGALTLAGGTLTSVNGVAGPANDGTYGNWIVNGTVSATDNSTVSSTTFAIMPSYTVNVSSGKVLTVSSSVINNQPAVLTSITRSAGTGTLSLTGANTYSGGTTLAVGTTQVGSNTALGTGTVTMTGGALSSNSTTARSLTNALSLNGAMTLGDATNTGLLTFSGTSTISGVTALTTASDVIFSGTLATNNNLTKGGAGNLFLTGGIGSGTGNFYAAQSGVFLAGYASGTPNQLDKATTIDISGGGGGYLNPCGNVAYTFNNAFTGAGDINVRNTSSGGVTFAGNMSGYTGQIRIYATIFEGANPVQKVVLTSAANMKGTYNYLSASGLTTLSQTFSYTGNTDPNHNQAFFITPGSTSGVTAIYSNDSSNGSSLSSTNVVWLASNNNAVFQIAANSGAITFSNEIKTQTGNTGVLSLTKTGNNAATLLGNNAFTGNVAVSQGTLNANSATALGAATSTAGISVTSGATLSLGGASNITYTAPRTLTLAGTGVSPGTPGALVIANAVTNTFSGIELTAGTLVRASESGTLTSPVTTNNHNLTFTVAAGKILTLPSTSVISASTSTVSYNTVSGDTGTAVVSAQNLYTNPTVIGQGTVRVGASSVGSPGSLTSGPLGRGQLTWNGGALDASTTATLGNNIVLNGNVVFRGTAALTLEGTVALTANSTITTDGSGGVLTLSGVMSGINFSLTKAGINTLILSGSNTRTGNTTIRAGTLVARAPTALGSSGTVTLNDASTGNLDTTLQINASTQDISINQSVVVANFGTGTTTIGSATTAGSFMARVLGSVTLAKDVILNGGVTGDRLEFSGGISGTGNVTVRGLSRVIFMTTANTYAGTTTIDDGAVLQLSDGTATSTSLLPDTQSVTINVNASLRLAKGANAQTIGALNGSGTVSQIVSGAATLIVGNNNGSGTFSGNLTQSAGSLALTKTGTGTQTLTGASTHSGGTNIAAGTLQTGNVQALGTSGTVTLTTSGAALQTLNSVNGKLTVANLTNSAGGTIRIGG